MDQIILFTFLALFPFGQIIRIGIIHPIDVVVGIGAVYAIFKKLSKPEIFKYFQHFLIFTTFSWIVSVFIFNQIEALYGLLYLVRLAAYFYFFLLVYGFAKKTVDKQLLLNSLLTVSVVSAIFGWIQYFTFPDLKPFFVWGWDEHLFRLVGTFLDPTFLGLIIVFGILISIFRKKWLFVFFLIISLAFTYSRASYLAFLAGVGYLFFTKINIKYVFYSVLILVGLIFFLPTTKNHSIEFFRSFSAIARIENYQSTLKIFQHSPIFGIGYDNLCIANQKYIAPQDFSSHACSGSDSSLLFILATTGVVGLFSFLHLITKVWKNSNNIFRVLLAALLIHSIFSNSLFYPWVMGYLIILLAISMKKN